MIITEDGTGLANSETYISVTESIDYHEKRGANLWLGLTTVEQEQALRRATDYMLSKYRMNWKGSRYHLAQRLDWPRVGVVRGDMGNNVYPGAYGQFVVPFTVVPEDIKNACAELAYRASQGPLVEDQTTGRQVTQESVGPITVKYEPGTYVFATYKQIDMMLAPYLANTSGAMVKLNRV